MLVLSCNLILGGFKRRKSQISEQAKTDPVTDIGAVLHRYIVDNIEKRHRPVKLNL